MRTLTPSRDLLLSVRRPGPQLALALGLAVAAALARSLLSMVEPHVVSAAVYFPAIVAAALLGGWRPGAITLVLCFSANLGLFGSPFAAHAATRPLNVALFLLVGTAAVAVPQWLGTLVVSLRQSRERLAARNLNYDTMFETITEGFAVCKAIRDPSGHLVDYEVLEMNPALRRMLGIGPDRAHGRMSDARGDWTEWFALCERVLATGKPATFETYDPRHKVWQEIRVSRLTTETMAQFFIDITDRKTEQARQAALFDELNHRVKNNLAIVSGVLTMQARTSEPVAADALRKAVARVHSIADLHSSLYRSHRTENVDVGLYLQELGANLSKSLLNDEQRIRICVDVPSATMSTDSAVPLGLVVSELVTNAVKYAYEPDQCGEINVTLEPRDGGALLCISDCGRGLPDEIGDQSEGLGMRLVRSMVTQVGGELTVGLGPGARFEIALPPGCLLTAQSSGA